jgi:NADH-quinone oxidoreductase subunit N
MAGIVGAWVTAVYVLRASRAIFWGPGPAVEPSGGERRGLGALVVAGLLGALAASWWLPVEVAAVGGAYVQDGFALYVQRIVLVAGLLGALGSIDHVDRCFPGRQGEYYLMLLSSLVGMTVLAGARELILLVVAFELMGIPLYVLAAMQKRQAAGIEGALKLYLTGAASSVVMLYGLSFVYGVTGTTSLPIIAQGLQAGAFQDPLLVLGLLLSLAGMGFKVGAVPFHMWVPDTYQGAPTPFVAFLSVAPKAAGFAAMIRLFIEGLGAMRDAWWPPVLVIGLATMLVGNVFAINQDNVKRLLAWSGIAHIGLLLIGFGLATVESLGILLFYLAAYVFTNMGAFLVAEVVGREGDDSLVAWRGLARRHPGLGLAMLLFLLSLGGIPFVAGFWAKILLFWSFWQAGMGIVVLLGAVLAVLALFYYLRVGRSMFIDRSEAPAPKVGLSMSIAIGLCLAGVLGMGVYPRPFIELAMAAAAGLLGG